MSGSNPIKWPPVITLTDADYSCITIASAALTERPFYEEWWFLLIMALVGLILILVLVFTLLLHGQSTKYKACGTGACLSKPSMSGRWKNVSFLLFFFLTKVNYFSFLAPLAVCLPCSASTTPSSCSFTSFLLLRLVPSADLLHCSQPCETLRRESLDVRWFACSGLVPTGMSTPLRPDDRGKSGSALSLRRHRSGLTAPPANTPPATMLLYAQKLPFNVQGFFYIHGDKSGQLKKSGAHRETLREAVVDLCD